MRILWLATKLPWPPRDGGRLVAKLTLEALAERGHELTVVAPSRDRDAIERSRLAMKRLGGRLEVVDVGSRPRLVDAALSPVSRRPWTIRRHAHGALRRRALELECAGSFDLVHAEQVQAIDGARGLERPLVLRAQNVESDLWRSLARRRPWLAPFLKIEADRLAAYEGAAVRKSSLTVALTPEDAGRLRQLAGEDEERPERESKVVVLEAPFPGSLPATKRQLEGDPPLVLFGSPGWWPNRDGAQFFLEEVWPQLAGEHPGARLHLFGFDGPDKSGGDGNGAVREGPSAQLHQHSPPESSADALPPGSILLVPLFVSSGVRMKILEAWARGVAVIASPAAARGLTVESGRQLMIAERPAEWSAAVARVVRERQSFLDRGREALAAHAPERIARGLEAVYEACLSKT